MMQQRKIELLSPAKNLECGIEAINHGADAVYIGAPKFGARSDASNSLEDITSLVNHAHLFNARIYVTLNTILKDEELKPAEEMAWALYNAGVDALIVQDMALLKMDLPPIPLHASTQIDNRTPEKVKFLKEAGFDQIVLARELSLDQIKAIHDQCDVSLEVFVHGALCVSFSGQCYISQATYGRSANRGECAQCCRLPYNLIDADGNVIIKNKHLLSLKDLNQSEYLEQLLDAGVTSLKIEGRLKDITYVKNVTASYRKKLDIIFAKRVEYTRSSLGTCTFDFTPQPDKSFNRGFTNYFLFGRTKDIFSFDTPKSLGEEMGKVKELRGNYLTVAGVKSFNNGDGVCFLNEQNDLTGFRVNRVEDNKLFPHEMPDVKPGTVLYRNHDQEFEKLLSRKSAERKVAVDILLSENESGFVLNITDEEGNRANYIIEREKEQARTPQTENLKNQLGKLGNTPFLARTIEVQFTDNWFLPASVLTDARRVVTDVLVLERKNNYQRKEIQIKKTVHPYPQKQLIYIGNVMNAEATSFYKEHGVEQIAPAYEKLPVKNVPLMFCKHCIRYSMGWCPVYHKKSSPYKEPFYVVNDNKKFLLNFDCRNCEMRLVDVTE